MKYAAIFAFVAFAFLAQANARSVEGISEDRGAIANAMKAKLLTVKERLNNMLDKASVKAKEGIVKLQQKADELIDKLKVKFHQVSDKVFAAAQNFVVKIEKFEDKFGAYFNESVAQVVDDVLHTTAEVESQTTDKAVKSEVESQ